MHVNHALMAITVNTGEHKLLKFATKDGIVKSQANLEKPAHALGMGLQENTAP